jgi:hypothetical protein
MEGPVVTLFWGRDRGEGRWMAPLPAAAGAGATNEFVFLISRLFGASSFLRRQILAGKRGRDYHDLLLGSILIRTDTRETSRTRSSSHRSNLGEEVRSRNRRSRSNWSCSYILLWQLNRCSQRRTRNRPLSQAHNRRPSTAKTVRHKVISGERSRRRTKRRRLDDWESG